MTCEIGICVTPSLSTRCKYEIQLPTNSFTMGFSVANPGLPETTLGSVGRRPPYQHAAAAVQSQAAVLGLIRSAKYTYVKLLPNHNH